MNEATHNELLRLLNMSLLRETRINIYYIKLTVNSIYFGTIIFKIFTEIYNINFPISTKHYTS